MVALGRLRKKDDEDSAPLAITPAWRRMPCASGREKATELPAEKLAEKIDEYFTQCADNDILPSYCDMAGVIGFDSLPQMMFHARRHPEVMRYISRGLLAVGAGYEELTAKGIRTGAFLLERLVGYDSIEPPSQAPTRPFMLDKTLDVNIRGVVQQQHVGSELSPIEAYRQLMKFKTQEEMVAVQGELIEEGSFIEIDDED
jgi:hypothetical protein